MFLDERLTTVYPPGINCHEAKRNFWYAPVALAVK
jgi:hypothetical protein